MSGQLGLIAPNNTNLNVDTSYFLKKGEPIVDADLIAPVSISAGSTTAVINVEGDSESGYFGSINITTGESLVSDQKLAITADPTASGVDVWIGANTADSVNRLLINGGDGLSRVNDPVYNPALYVFGAPAQDTTEVDAINNAVTARTFRTIALGNIPSGYNFYQVWLDLNTTVQTDMLSGVPRIRFYLTDSVNGAYDPTKAITSWNMPDSFPIATGSPLVLSDVPLIFYGVPAGRNLYIGMTFSTLPPAADSNVNIQNPKTDYSLISQPSKAV